MANDCEVSLLRRRAFESVAHEEATIDCSSCSNYLSAEDINRVATLAVETGRRAVGIDIDHSSVALSLRRINGVTPPLL